MAAERHFTDNKQQEKAWTTNAFAARRRFALYAERLAIGYEQARQATRLAEIRRELADLEPVARDG